jgi:hypothetical protein
MQAISAKARATGAVSNEIFGRFCARSKQDRNIIKTRL